MSPSPDDRTDEQVLADQPEQMRVRREKLDRLRVRGVDPYPVWFPRTTTLADLRSAHCVL